MDRVDQEEEIISEMEGRVDKIMRTKYLWS